MHAASGEGIEIDRHGGDQRLAFAGLHLSDAALMQHHAANQLHVEMTLAERALGGLGTVAKASGIRSSSSAPASTRARKSAVRARNSSSVSAATSGSSALICATAGPYFLS